MAEPKRTPWLGPLGLRLAAAFIVVALSAIGVFAAMTLLASRHEVSGLTDRNRQDALAAISITAAEAYRSAGGWSGADLAGAAAIAARDQATLTVVDATGQVVAAPTDELADMMIEMHGLAAVDTPRGDPVSASVEVDGGNVGAVMLRFPTESPSAARHVRDALARNAVYGVVLASLVALVVAVYVSVRVSRPVSALTVAATDLAQGRRAARVEADGPGELRVLATAFNEMADHLDREDQLRRNLVADVAHELRTPLAVLQGSMEALIDGVDEFTPVALSSMNEEVTRLRRLVGDLETLAAAEAAGLRQVFERVDLADVSASSVDLLRPLADDRGVTIETRLEPALLIGDADRLQQVAVNLIANATKFVADGGWIGVTTSTTGDRVRLEVADNGPGIPADELDKVFQRFWRGANADKASGSGIGLAVVAELVAAHGGTVSAQPRPEGGVVFTAAFPRAGV